MKRLFLWLALVCLVAVAPRSYAQDDVPISPEARRQFDIGVKLLQDPDGARYEEAYRAFKKAYAISPSPKILLNLGISAMKLERDGEALGAFRDYLAKVSGIDDDLKAQVQNDITTLEGAMVPLKLTITPEGATVQDVRVPVEGNRIVNSYGPVKGTLDIGIRSGHHELSVELEGYESAKLSFDAEPGNAVEKQLTLEKKGAAAAAPTPTPAPTPDKPEPVEAKPNIPAFAMIGVTAALAIAAAATGGVALVKGNQFDEINDGTQVDKAQERRNDAKRLNIVTDVLLGVTAASAIVTVVLFVVPRGGAGSTEPPKHSDGDRASWQLLPAAGPEGASLVLQRAF